MWIKEPTYPLGESSDDILNFLFNEGKFYFMDNHLAAAWCWLQKIDIMKSYNLYHIDKHYDLLDNEEDIKREILEKGINLSNSTIDEYLSFEQSMGKGKSVPLFRYANYLLNLQLVYNSIYRLKYFATHRCGNYKEGFLDPEKGDFEKSENEIVKDLGDDMLSHSEHEWILNIDLDYFFIDNDESFQYLTDKYINLICKNIEYSMDSISVITVSLSPEFCGGWRNAYRIATLISDYFNIDFCLQLK